MKIELKSPTSVGAGGGVGGVGFGGVWVGWPNKGLCGPAGEWGFGLCRALHCLVRRTTNQFYKIRKKYQMNLKFF
jgi:hypothetical protein